jgi:phenylpyruvate tautomerase PptA (4-oxalocrotonate tautomerase family)
MPRVEINMVEGDHSVDEKLTFMKKTTEAVV